MPRSDHPDNVLLTKEHLNLEILSVREERKITDKWFLGVLAVVWFIMTIVGFCATGIIPHSSIPAGNPFRLIYPTDYTGKICGVDYKTKPFGYYLPGRVAVCVESCPKNNDFNQFICQYDVQNATVNNVLQGYEYVLQQKCMYQVETKAFLHRCIDTFGATNALQGANDAASKSGLTTAITSIYHSAENHNTGWTTYFLGDVYTLSGYVFGFGIGVAIGVAFLYTFLLQTKGMIIIILSIFLWSILALMVIGSICLITLSASWSNDHIHSWYEIIAMRVFAFFGIIFSGLYFCMAMVLQKRLQYSVKIVGVIAKVIADFPYLFLLPILQAIGIVMFLVPWMIYLVCLAASGSNQTTSYTFQVDGKDYTASYTQFSYSYNTQWAFLFLLFCLFWTSEFIVALGKLTVSLIFTNWYFYKYGEKHFHITLHDQFKSSSFANSTLLLRICQSLIYYHAGSCALGGLLMTIVKIIRKTIRLLEKQMEKHLEDPECVDYFQCFLVFFNNLLEDILDFVNNNAYILIAFYGDSFCPATRRAFFAMSRNILSVEAMPVASMLILFIGKFLIPVTTTFFAYLALAYAYPSGEVSGIVAPLVLIFCLSYWMGCMVLEVYGMGMETLCMCYILDTEINGRVPKMEEEGDLFDLIAKTTDWFHVYTLGNDQEWVYVKERTKKWFDASKQQLHSQDVELSRVLDSTYQWYQGSAAIRARNHAAAAAVAPGGVNRSSTGTTSKGRAKVYAAD